jgi:hypothetical protein
MFSRNRKHKGSQARAMTLSANNLRGFVPAALGLLMALGAAAGEPAGGYLDGYRWEKRPLLLFAPAPGAPVYGRVPAVLRAGSDGIADRDMLILELFESGLVRADGTPTTAVDADALRRRFAVLKGDLTVLLLGKDGGLKLRQTGRLDLEAVFALIDTMPMRQREMRHSGQ